MKTVWDAITDQTCVPYEIRDMLETTTDVNLLRTVCVGGESIDERSFGKICHCVAMNPNTPLDVIEWLMKNYSYTHTLYRAMPHNNNPETLKHLVAGHGLARVYLSHNQHATLDVWIQAWLSETDTIPGRKQWLLGQIEERGGLLGVLGL